MKVTVKIAGLSEPPAGFWRLKEVPVDFPVNSLGELIEHLLSGMDAETKEIFRLEPGKPSPDLELVRI